MKKTSFFTMILLIVASIICGCGEAAEDKSLAVCGSYAVPGMFCHDLKGGSYSCNVVERDAYGRILFIYETTSIISKHITKAYVICQKMDTDYVYFYEDVGYAVIGNGKDDIESLKQANNWSEPLDETRMSKRPVRISYDSYIVIDSLLDYSDLKSACLKKFCIEESQLCMLTTLDINSNGQELLFLTIENATGVEAYYILANANYEIAYIAADNISNEELGLFKQENAWVYG